MHSQAVEKDGVNANAHEAVVHLDDICLTNMITNFKTSSSFNTYRAGLRYIHTLISA